MHDIDAWEARSGTDATVIVARIINRGEYSLTTTQYNNNVAQYRRRTWGNLDPV